jgi:hypothetical protein
MAQEAVAEPAPKPKGRGKAKTAPAQPDAADTAEAKPHRGWWQRTFGE